MQMMKSTTVPITNRICIFVVISLILPIKYSFVAHLYATYILPEQWSLTSTLLLGNVHYTSSNILLVLTSLDPNYATEDAPRAMDAWEKYVNCFTEDHITSINKDNVSKIRFRSIIVE